MRVSNDQNGAIAALKEGTRPGRPLAFKQADMLVSLDFCCVSNLIDIAPHRSFMNLGGPWREKEDTRRQPSCLWR